MADSISIPLRALPHVRLAGRFPLSDRGHTRTFHTTQFHALHLHEYHATLRMDGQLLQLSPGDVVLSPRGGYTSYDLPRPGYHWCVHFRSPPARGGETFDLPLHIHAATAQHQLVARFMTIMRWMRGSADDTYAATGASSALLELLLALTAMPPAAGDTRSHADGAVERAADLLDRTIDQPVAATDLARAVGLSQNYLARRFRQQFGMTISRYQLKRRIDSACQFLNTTDLSIGEIAARVGMHDPQHFNKSFRRITGLSPSAYRAQ